MNINTIKRHIINYMNQTLLASLSFLRGGPIHSKMVVFGNDKKGNIYICVQKEASILSALQNNPQVALLISREEARLEDICALSISGTASILQQDNTQEIMFAYDVLSQKSPLLGNIPYTEEIHKHQIIKIAPKEFHFQQYNSYKKQKKPIILKKK